MRLRSCSSRPRAASPRDGGGVPGQRLARNGHRARRIGTHEAARPRRPVRRPARHRDARHLRTGALAALRERLSGRRFDMLFVNAGTTNGPTETIGEVTTDEFVRVMITNALAPMRVIETLQDLVTDDGLIGAMSSGQGSVANNVSGMREVYRGSKAALNQFMRSFAVRRYAACNGADGARLGPHGTRWAGCAPDDRGKRAESRRRADRKAWAPGASISTIWGGRCRGDRELTPEARPPRADSSSPETTDIVASATIIAASHNRMRLTCPRPSP